MPDDSRFQTVRSVPDRAHLSYHGAPLVELTFRVVDWWLGSRRRPQGGSTERQFPISRLQPWSIDRRFSCQG
jgi:hypothetical protein